VRTGCWVCFWWKHPQFSASWWKWLWEFIFGCLIYRMVHWRMAGNLVHMTTNKNGTNSCVTSRRIFQPKLQETRWDFVYFGVIWTVLQWKHVDLWLCIDLQINNYCGIKMWVLAQPLGDINWLLWWVKSLAIKLPCGKNVFLICLTIFVCLFHAHIQNIET